jgi:hypothetical protein
MVKFSASGVANPAFADVDGDCVVVDEDGQENYFKNIGTAKNPVFVHVTNSEDPFKSLLQQMFFTIFLSRIGIMMR